MDLKTTTRFFSKLNFFEMKGFELNKLEVVHGTWKTRPTDFEGK